MNKITPFLWFDGNAEEAMNFYTSVFRNAKAGKVTRLGSGPAANVLTASFGLEGLQFTALNAGPQFKFNESVSFYVDCADQAEVDHYWDKLSEGGSEQQCGWLKDKFGLSWQIIPAILPRYMQDSDPAKAKRVLDAMMQMKKIDVAALERAHAGAM